MLGSKDLVLGTKGMLFGLLYKVLSDEFCELNFEPSSHTDASGKSNKSYAMTKDGFVMLAMGYSDLVELEG